MIVELLPQSFKFEEQSEAVLGGELFGVESPHDVQVGVHAHWGILIQVLEQVQRMTEGMGFVME